MRFLAILPILFYVAMPSLAADEQTWVEIDNIVYGAKGDERGPIGGGKGYANIVTKGDFIVKDLDALLDALSKAKAGQVVLNNTFRAAQTPVVIRGVPEDKCHVHHNWFVTHNEASQAVRSSGRTKVFCNVYAAEPMVVK